MAAASDCSRSVVDRAFGGRAECFYRIRGTQAVALSCCAVACRPLSRCGGVAVEISALIGPGACHRLCPCALVAYCAVVGAFCGAAACER